MELRRAVPGDEEAVAAVHVRSWQEAYRGLLPASYLLTLDPAQRARRYTFDDAPGHPVTVVAVDGATVLGFATTGPCRDDHDREAGELHALYLDPARWGRGVGRALIADARARLGAAGHAEAVVWWMEGNRRAERFYGIDGWRPDGGDRTLDIHGVTVREHRGRRRLP